MSARTYAGLTALVQATLFTVVTVLLLGILYPYAIAAVAAVALPGQAGGSIVIVDGKPIGSRLVGQLFTSPRYFAGRPSAAGKDGYDPTATGGTNYGPTSKKFVDAVRAQLTTLRRENPDATVPLPIDLVTASGSGIDPDISPQGALYQAPRIARARSIPLRRVLDAIAAATHPRQLGFLGEPHVNVLEANLALDGLLR